MRELFADLANILDLKNKWDWVTCDCAGIGRHHWAFAANHVNNSDDGWIIDASHGAKDRSSACAVPHT
jgi:hypothetical protein